MKVQQIIIYSRLVVQQIVVQRCNRLYICNVVGVLLWCPVIADVLVQSVRVVQLNCVKVHGMLCEWECVVGWVISDCSLA